MVSKSTAPSGQKLRLKLKGLRNKLRIWNKEVFGYIERRKKACLEEIQRWDKKEEEEGLFSSKRIAHKEAQKEFERVIEMEIMWRQKSRMQRLKEGD